MRRKQSEHMSRRSLRKLVAEAEEKECEVAKSSGTLGFMAKAMVQVSLAHKSPFRSDFVRKNGNISLSMMTRSMIG